VPIARSARSSGPTARFSAEKPELVALNKCDALDDEAIAEKSTALTREAGRPVHSISAATGLGVRELLFAALGIIREARAAEVEAERETQAATVAAEERR